jgi:glycosyltransferase involved in cell wall biosynthesis
MPKVLRILNRLNVGGPTYNVAYLSKYLPDNFETKVLAGYNELHEANSGYILDNLGVQYSYVPNMYRNIHPKNDFKAYQFIIKQLKVFSPDIVHTHAAKAGALGRLAARRAMGNKVKILHTYHGNVFDGYFSPLKAKIFVEIEKYLCRLSDAIVSVSEIQKHELVEKYKITTADKVHVIPLGFHLDKFYVNRELNRKIFREYYKLNDETVAITITGRIAPVKNLHFFIDVMRHVKNNLAGEQFIKIFIVGNGESFEEIVLYAKQNNFTVCLPHETNFNAEIILTSWRKDIDVINAGSDVVSLTSINEGTPVSIIEAMASSKAVICTDVGGVKEIVTNDTTGFVCETNVSLFAKKLLLLIKSSEKRNEFSLRAEKLVKEKYSYSRLVNDTTNLYNRLLNL